MPWASSRSSASAALRLSPRPRSSAAARRRRPPRPRRGPAAARRRAPAAAAARRRAGRARAAGAPRRRPATIRAATRAGRRSWASTSAGSRSFSIARARGRPSSRSSSDRPGDVASWTTRATSRPPRWIGVATRPAGAGASTTSPAASTYVSYHRRGTRLEGPGRRARRQEPVAHRRAVVPQQAAPTEEAPTRLIQRDAERRGERDARGRSREKRGQIPPTARSGSRRPEQQDEPADSPRTADQDAGQLHRPLQAPNGSTCTRQPDATHRSKSRTDDDPATRSAVASAAASPGSECTSSGFGPHVRQQLTSK